MSYYIDTHCHTCFSGDSDTPVTDQIERAIQLGMPALCITDHQDFDYPEGDTLFEFNTDDYFAKLLPLKEQYKDRIDLRIGVELGLQTGIPTDLAAYAKKYDFDYIIGSTHVCLGVDPYYPDLYERVPEDEVYEAYFREQAENIKTWSCFDVAGHLDYIVRYGPNRNANYSYKKYADYIDEILKTLIANGKGLECNSAGLKAGLGHAHPTEDILLRYRELGGEIITLGSDGHIPEHLGYLFEHAGSILKTCGFKYYAAYKNRKPEFYPL